jgi:hypothetical protein
MLPLNKFKKCAFFEPKVFPYFEVGQSLRPMSPGSLVHPRNGNLQQLRYLMNSKKAALASSHFRCGCVLWCRKEGAA